ARRAGDAEGARPAGLRARPRAHVLARRLRHLAEAAVVDVVDEAPDLVLPRDERARLDARDRLADVLVEVVERLGGPFRLDAGVLLHLAPEVVVAEGEHPAVG